MRRIKNFKPSYLRVPIKRSLQDLGLWIMLFVFSLIIWLSLSDFTFSSIIGRNDATSGLLWYLRDIERSTLSSLSYAPQLLGGYPLSLALGSLWPIQWLLKSKLVNFYHAHNFLFLFSQVTIGYFAIRFIRTSEIKKKGRSQRTLENLAIFLCLAFSPILGWRFAYGHINLILGALSFVSLIYLLESWEKNSPSLIDYFLALISLSLSLNFVTFQLLAYVLYVLPLYYLISRSGSVRKFPWKDVGLFILVFSVLNFYYLLPFLSFYINGSSARGGEIDTFSYAPFTLKSFFATLFWNNTFINLDPVKFKWHELHYPVGFGYLGLIMIPGRWKKIFVGFLLILVFLYLLQVSPIVEIFSSLPLISVFRVPQRILILLGLLTSLGALKWLVPKIPEYKVELRSSGLIIVAALAGIVLSMKFQNHVDLFVLSTLVLYGLSFYLKRADLSLGSFLLLGTLSAGAFFAPFMPFLQKEEIERISSTSLQSENPYERAFINFQVKEFHSNTAYALDIPSLNGYFYGPHRFSEFIPALYEVPFDPLYLNWNFKADHPTALLVARLYNIRSVVSYQNSEFSQTPIEVNHDGIIFPEVVLISDNLEEIASGLRENWQRAYLSGKDKDLLKYPPCPNKKVAIKYVNHRLEIKTDFDHDCLAVIPTNYSDNLAMKDSNKLEQPLFPVNYALLGTIFQKGARQYRLSGKYFTQK